MEDYYSGSRSATVLTFTDQVIVGSLRRTQLAWILETRAGGKTGLNVILRDIPDPFGLIHCTSFLCCVYALILKYFIGLCLPFLLLHVVWLISSIYTLIVRVFTRITDTFNFNQICSMKYRSEQRKYELCAGLEMVYHDHLCKHIPDLVEAELEVVWLVCAFWWCWHERHEQKNPESLENYSSRKKIK